jgi:hypothetical protein
MKTRCIQQVEAAIGRTLGKGEAERIEERLTSNLRELARTDANFAGLDQAGKLKAAAELSLQQDTEQAAKAAQRKALNLAAQTREAAQLTTRAAELGEKDATHRALFERLRQVDQYVSGVRAELFGRLVDTMKAASPRFLGLIENPEAVRDFVREVYGEDTGNPIARDGAKAYLEQMEAIRQRMNAAGADIGKLDYGYLPQPHDTGAIVKAGKDKWIGSVLPKLDRSRYFNTDGTAMTDAQMVDFLDHAYDTLATEGLANREAGQRGMGSRASRFDEAHRAIHFKDPASYLGYMQEFGQGSTFEAIHNHVNAQAKNIGLMESFGSNPSTTYQLLKDTSEIEDSRVAGRKRSGVYQFGATTDMVWDVLNGTVATPVNPRAAAIGRAIRNWTSATKLGGVMLSSINDAPTWLATARYNGVPLGKSLRNLLSSLTGKHLTDDAARLGLAVESMAGEMQTWHADTLRQDWAGKIANATMKLQLVESWTHRLRAGLGLMLQDQLATLKNTDWAALSDFDRERFKRAGLTEKDWQIWQAATPENIRGRELLTANAIRDVHGFTDAEVNSAVAKMLGFIDNEAKTAVLAPDVVTRATITQGAKAGTLGGEIGRSLMLFKSFPLAMVLRNLERIRSIPSAKGKVAYSLALLTGLTLMGALSVELKDLVAGKNPRDATTPKFWGAAFAQGGGLGIFGDILYTGMGGNSRGGQPNWTSLAGPVAGTAADFFNVTLGNFGQALQGKDTKAAAELLRFARQNIPFLNIWYLKSAIDHAGFNELQDTLSPGYLARQKAAARRDWGSTYWWEPDEQTPSQMVDLTTTAGR